MTTLLDPSTDDTPTESFDDPHHSGGFSFGKVIALCLATTLLGLGIGMTVQRMRADRSAEPKPTALDVGFLRDMMSHHEQAIELSVLIMNRGSDNSVRQEAVDILLAQRGEYVQMGDQLDKWGIDAVPEDGQAMGWMGMPVPTASMPGLATPEQIAKLKTLTGTAADVEFLRLMINHHASGADMAQYAADRSQVPFVAVMAGRMAAVQSVEINEMRAFARRLGTEIPAPAKVDHSGHSMDDAPAGVPASSMVDHSNHG